jgi:hypothetical protein
MCDSNSSNIANFATDSYNLETLGQSWCVKRGSIYTNPNANFSYFNSKCGDPYTYYNFWYRRFPDQNRYLNCYNIPYRDPLLRNSNGYIGSNSDCRLYQNLKYNKTDNGFRYYG